MYLGQNDGTVDFIHQHKRCAQQNSSNNKLLNSVQYRPRSAQHKRNYSKHRKNRFNGIFQIQTVGTMSDHEDNISGKTPEDNSVTISSTSSNSSVTSETITTTTATTSTIGVYEMSPAEANNTFGEDGTCFFVVANVPQQRSRVVSSFIEERIPQCSTALLSPPQPIQSSPCRRSHNKDFVMNGCCTTSDDLCVVTMTNEHSVSSGVGSVESSELDSPNPSTVSSSSNSTVLFLEDTSDNNIDIKTCHRSEAKNTNIRFAQPSRFQNCTCNPSNILTKIVNQNGTSRCDDCTANRRESTPTKTELFRNKDDRRESGFSSMNSSLLRCSPNTEEEKDSIVIPNSTLSKTDVFLRRGDSRRESSFSSMNSSILRSSPTKINSSFTKRNSSSPTDDATRQSPPTSKKDEDKEILLCRIKADLYDPLKEENILKLRQTLNESGCHSFTEQITKSECWTPAFISPSTITAAAKPPYKSALKKSRRVTLIEEIKARHAARSVETAKRETRSVCPLARSELVKVIQQVRQCLRFTPIKLESRALIFKCQFQVHQKIKLKRYPVPSSAYWKEVDATTGQDIVPNSSSSKERLEITKSLSCKVMKEAAGKGDIKRILNLINSNTCAHQKPSHCQAMPAFHNALQKEHFRTAILLLEAGTDIKLYTEQRIREYNRMMDVVDRNRHAFPHYKRDLFQ